MLVLSRREGEALILTTSDGEIVISKENSTIIDGAGSEGDIKARVHSAAQWQNEMAKVGIEQPADAIDVEPEPEMTVGLPQGARKRYEPNSGRRRPNCDCSRCTMLLCIWLTRLSLRSSVAPISFMVSSS